MSKPPNSAARNAMSNIERQCYDWGWEDAEARALKLIEDYKNKPDFTLDNLESLIKGEQK